MDRELALYYLENPVDPYDKDKQAIRVILQGILDSNNKAKKIVAKLAPKTERPSKTPKGRSKKDS